MPMLRQITGQYSVSPQLSPHDMAAVALAGYRTVICNRPDAEVPPEQQAAPMAAAAEAAGLHFEVLPLTHHTMTPENVDRHRGLIEASDGPVLAYCRSGTRCTVVWALGEAAERPADEILDLAGRAGYDLTNIRPVLEAIHAG